jgi:hypothetical protein
VIDFDGVRASIHVPTIEIKWMPYQQHRRFETMVLVVRGARISVLRDGDEHA